MRYENIKKALFIERPNRFIAYAKLNEEIVKCHVKNTGRCRELLIPGTRVWLEKSENPARKTAYDLIAVEKGDRLVNMDAQAPNRVFGEWAATCDVFGKVLAIKPEYRYGESRLDFCLETAQGRHLVEVKGVTLEEDGHARFPDAPTERGVKHIRELQKAVKEGYEACLFFVIQMDYCRYFTPNRQTHNDFADALKAASDSGVRLFAVTCHVKEDALSIADFAEIRL